MSLDSLLENLKSKVAAAPPIGDTLKFDFGEHQLVLDGTNGSNELHTSDRDTACTIRMELDDFKRILSGELNAITAVMTGKLRIEGNMGVAMQLQSIFS